MRIHYAISLLLPLLLLSCEHTSYDTGDGRYSHMQTDYVTVTVHDDYVQSIVTDEGRSLAYSKGMTYDVEPVDTTLRWLLYYNDNGNDPIEIVGRNTMWLLKPKERYEIAMMKTDPVTVTGVWVAKNGKYLNLRLGLKTGKTDDRQAKHTVSLIKEGVSDDVVYYTLYHDQADIPQYYTQEYFFTVEAPEQKEIDLTINTYNGVWHKQFIIHNSQFTVHN